ncbi:orotate phosphoribosyltransferase [Candidatus Woesearchaeota archaeon]|nr:orotate phosphoribosyltransferase [Candidatus Woesearchaeota archaeon]
MGGDTAETVAKILLEINAVTLNYQKPYRYASGILSPIYCDNRLLMSYPEKRKKIIEFFAEAVKNIQLEIICGTESAGIPHAAWLSEKLNKPMIFVRKKAKGYGKENLIEGKLEKGQKVVVIEDLISTGGSSVAAVQGVRDQGGTVEYCIAIFTYEMEKAKKLFEESNCKLITLSNFSTLVSVAEKMGKITEEEKKKILEWNKNPSEWGRLMGFE